MKEKDINWIHFQDVMAAIQTFLDEEASRESRAWNAPFSPGMTECPAQHDGQDQGRHALPIVQYYLARQKKHPSVQMLRSLPPDLLIRC